MQRRRARFYVFPAAPKPSHPAVSYPNFAALDGIDEKMSLIDKKIWGSIKQAAQSDAERESIRTVFGGSLAFQERHTGWRLFKKASMPSPASSSIMFFAMISLAYS